MTPDSPLARRERLAALRATRLLDSPPSDDYDRLTRLVCRLTGAPVALVTLVADDHQFFLSQQGLGEPWATERRTPLSHSFCQHVVADDDAFAVTDAPQHERVRANDAIGDLGVVAYLGVPVHAADGEPLGALCAIDHEPRTWTEADRAALEDLAALAETELVLLNERQRRKRQAHTLTIAEQRARRRLAEVLHDDLQQVLVGALLHLGTREALATPETMRSLLREALRLARDMSYQLAPPLLDNESLGTALVWLADLVEKQHGLRVEVNGGADCFLDDDDLLALAVRFVHAALDALAPHTDRVQMHIRLRPEAVELSMHTDDELAPALLASNSEDLARIDTEVAGRLTALGGALRIDAGAATGTTLHLDLPRSLDA